MTNSGFDGKIEPEPEAAPGEPGEAMPEDFADARRWWRRGKIWENRRKKAGANLVMGKKWKEFGWDSEVALKNMPQRSQYTQYSDQSRMLITMLLIRILRPELQEAYRLAMISWQLDAFLSPQVESQNMSEQS